MTGQIRYRLRYLADHDDMLDDYYLSDRPVQVGDVIKVDYGFFHQVRAIEVLKTGPYLDLAQSAQSEAEAPHMPP